MKPAYLHSLKVSSPKNLLITEEKISKFTVEKPSRHLFKQVIKVNITSNKTKLVMYPRYDTPRREHHFFIIPAINA